VCLLLGKTLPVCPQAVLEYFSQAFLIILRIQIAGLFESSALIDGGLCHESNIKIIERARNEKLPYTLLDIMPIK
jgi:hypothetical protein